MDTTKEYFLMQSLSTTDKGDYLIIGVNLYEGVYNDEYRPAGLLRIYSDLIEDNLSMSNHYISKIPITDLGDLYTPDIDNMLNDLEALKKHLHGKTHIYIGGDHLITYPITKTNRIDALIVYDAHLDMKDTYRFRRWSNATVMRRIHEDMETPIYYWGVRGYSRDEIEYISENREIQINQEEIPKNLDIHVSIDLDVLDPTIISQVAYPEPNGWTINQLLQHFTEIASYNTVKSIDIVEYRPVTISRGEISTILRILYESIGILHEITG